MIIDCHGHFTTEPQHFHEFRKAQIAYVEGKGPKPDSYPGISSEELGQIIADNQLKLQQERGTDFTLLSPRASGMRHDVNHVEIAVQWAQISNNNIHAVTQLYPENFAAVAQLPQTPGGDWDTVIAELERCAELGFVGVNLNPDPSGGRWDGPALTDSWWDPIWEALQRLDMPAMIHVSGSCSPAVHTTGGHYIAGDTIAFMQLLKGDLFQRYPNLRLIVPHGGGAVPYHWGRYRGLATMLQKPDLAQHLMQNVYFDTCVYHQAGVDLLLEVIDDRNVLFGSELLGAVKAIDPTTGFSYDDTKRYVDAAELTAQQRTNVFSANARRVYPKLDEILRAQGR